MPKLNALQIESFQKAYSMEPSEQRHRSQKRKNRNRETERNDTEKLVRLAELQGSVVTDRREGSKIGQTVTIGYASNGQGEYVKAPAYLSVIVAEYLDGSVKILSGDVWRVRRLYGQGAAYQAVPTYRR